MAEDRETVARPMAISAYYYRRSLGLRELLPAVGIAAGAGLAAFYVARLMLQRTPLLAVWEADPVLRRRPSAGRTRDPRDQVRRTGG